MSNRYFLSYIDGFRCLLRTTSPFGGFQDLNELKPYLRSLSSMTDEEREYLESLTNFHATPDVVRDKIDFYLERHLDFRGLIPKGLAIEAPEGMYKND